MHQANRLRQLAYSKNLIKSGFIDAISLYINGVSGTQTVKQHGSSFSCDEMQFIFWSLAASI